LRKHKIDVKRFFRAVRRSAFRTDIAQHWQKRLLRNEERLFLFLNHDNVPWNNNYAENAIKNFAEFRHKFSRRRLNQDGLKEYLVLLSIQHTCKLRGIDFLQFLLSGRKTLPPQGVAL
jgi:transposase IS66 family protein